jgi:hypothetical protein
MDTSAGVQGEARPAATGGAGRRLMLPRWAPLLRPGGGHLQHSRGGRPWRGDDQCGACRRWRWR